MAFTNLEKKEIHCKILYAGLPGSGKTENLLALTKQFSQKLSSGESILSKDKESEGFVEFLPISMGSFKNFHIRLHLYTISLEIPFKTVYHNLLNSIDGLVFVVDSEETRLIENFDYLEKLIRFLKSYQIDFAALPVVFQYNKRDLLSKGALGIYKKHFNRFGKQETEASAHNAQGTIETLMAITESVTAQINIP